MNYKDLLEKWSEYLLKVRCFSNHTKRSYVNDVSSFNNFLKDHFGKEVDIDTLKNLTLTDLRSWLSKRYQQKYNTRSTARAISSVKNFFSFLKKEELIDSQVFELLKTPRIKKTLPHPLSVEQVFSLIDNINNLSKGWIGERDKALFMLLYGTGIRISEALALNLNDIESKFITIYGKGKKYRQVPLLDSVK
ncbi:MAG: site-specific integrase, partial [Alphaproteobacteria bacterium]